MLKTHCRLHEEARGDGIWKLCAGMALGGACALRAYGKAADVSSSLIQKCSDNVCFLLWHEEMRQAFEQLTTQFALP